jgi:hypothetical protein
MVREFRQLMHDMSYVESESDDNHVHMAIFSRFLNKFWIVGYRFLASNALDSGHKLYLRHRKEPVCRFGELPQNCNGRGCCELRARR